MSEESARQALEDAVAALSELRTVGVSPLEHDLSSQQLYVVANKVRERRTPELRIVWRGDGTLAFEPRLCRAL
jgi:hypothetical protein